VSVLDLIRPELVRKESTIMAKQRAGAEEARAAKVARAAKEKALKKAEALQKAKTKAVEQAAKQKAMTAKPTSVFPDEATLKKSQGKKDTRKKAAVTHLPSRVSPPRSAKKRKTPVIPPKG
jgi:dethiobiotin synthetase